MIFKDTLSKCCLSRLFFFLFVVVVVTCQINRDGVGWERWDTVLLLNKTKNWILFSFCPGIKEFRFYFCSPSFSIVYDDNRTIERFTWKKLCRLVFSYIVVLRHSMIGGGSKDKTIGFSFIFGMRFKKKRANNFFVCFDRPIGWCDRQDMRNSWPVKRSSYWAVIIHGWMGAVEMLHHVI